MEWLTVDAVGQTVNQLATWMSAVLCARIIAHVRCIAVVYMPRPFSFHFLFVVSFNTISIFPLGYHVSLSDHIISQCFHDRFRSLSLSLSLSVSPQIFQATACRCKTVHVNLHATHTLSMQGFNSRRPIAVRPTEAKPSLMRRGRV